MPSPRRPRPLAALVVISAGAALACGGSIDYDSATGCCYFSGNGAPEGPQSCDNTAWAGAVCCLEDTANAACHDTGGDSGETASDTGAETGQDTGDSDSAPTAP